MLGLTQQEFVQLLIDAIINGIMWGLTFYYIRKGLNKRNFNENPAVKRKAFYYDAIYGGLAAFAIVILKFIANVVVRRIM